jgi:hypothetical protein
MADVKEFRTAHEPSTIGFPTSMLPDVLSGLEFPATTQLGSSGQRLAPKRHASRSAGSKKYRMRHNCRWKCYTACHLCECLGSQLILRCREDFRDNCRKTHGFYGLVISRVGLRSAVAVPPRSIDSCHPPQLLPDLDASDRLYARRPAH